MQHCSLNDRWPLASKAWLCYFLEPGGVVWSVRDECYYLCLGPVGRVVALAWPLEGKDAPTPGWNIFWAATVFPPGQRKMRWP
eukprot:7411779-Lingulodinium_polyedra.AAC.1